MATEFFNKYKLLSIFQLGGLPCKKTDDADIIHSFLEKISEMNFLGDSILIFHEDYCVAQARTNPWIKEEEYISSSEKSCSNTPSKK